MDPLTSKLRAYLHMHPAAMPAEVVDAVAPELEGKPRATARQRASRLRRRMAATEAQDTPTSPPPTARPDLADLDAEGLLRWQLDRLDEAVEAGRPGSDAYTRAVRSVGEVHTELQALLAPPEDTHDPAAMSPEEWEARVREDARAATDEDLDVYMEEWLDRRDHLLEVEGDRLRLVRRVS